MAESKDLYKINRSSKAPLYDLIEQNFRELIASGQLKSGNPVPSEWELADLYGVSRLTVRRALDDLARQGWLNRRHGVGTFVAKPPVTQIVPSKLSFSEQMREIGRVPSSRLIRLQAINSDADVAARLNLQSGDPVAEIARIRLADGEPILYETAYLSLKRFPGLEAFTELAEASLYETLSTRFQTPVVTMIQTLEPVLLSESEAQLLDASPGAPALLSETTSYSSDDEPIEYSWSVTRGDKCKFYFNFRRSDSNS